MIIAAKTILTLVLCWPRKAHVFCLKNIAVCPVSLCCKKILYMLLIEMLGLRYYFFGASLSL